MGDYRQALPLYQQARDLTKKLLTENHPDYACSLNNLAALLHCLQKPKEATPLTQQALGIQRAFLDTTFTAQSNRQRLDFLVRLERWLSLFLTLAPAAEVASGRVYDQVLAWKGALAQRQAEEHLAHDHPDLHQLLYELRQVRAGLAHLARTPAAHGAQQADWLKRFTALEQAKEDLEARLAQKSADFRRLLQQRRATTQDVQKVLPAGTALVDFVLYWHCTPPPQGKGKFVWERKLLAFIVTPDREPVLVHLGPAKAIDKAIGAWRQAVAKRDPLDQSGAELARRVWQPLRPHLRNAKVVLISPDGPLCGLPFAALPGRRPRTYLVEEVALGYVTSGRQLLELEAARHNRRSQGLLTVGGLPYGQAPAAAAPAGGSWPELPGTGLEAQRVAALFRRAVPREPAPRQLQGAAVDAAALKRELPPAAKASPRYLHLATHAFFEQYTPPRPGPLSGFGEAGLGMHQDFYTYERNPLLRSGLVLAGANHSPAQGILSAEEVEDLDLRGVDLAVLSACDTGLGKEATLEGVLGLQRSFQGAGARSLVVSLWSVNDAATSVLMEEFYTNLWVKKLPKLQALQQAQLTILRNPDLVAKRGKELRELLAKRGVLDSALAARGLGKEAHELPPHDPDQPSRSHPALWAAFVLSGDPGDLSKIEMPSVSPNAGGEGRPGPPAVEVRPEEPSGAWLYIAMVAGSALGLLLVGVWAVRRFRRKLPTA
jgi:CHAT domain-containing protein